jgi:ABC-type branched-subunit amino acid transport system substrate-binding protein
LSDIRKWSGVVVLASLVGVAQACTVGEGPPEGPAPVDEPGVEAPVEPDVPGDVERDARAAELLEEAQAAYDAGRLEEALDVAGRVVAEYGGTPSAETARWIAAQASFALSRYEQARDLALDYAEDQPSASEALEEADALAELAADALEEPTSASPVVGAVLPRSGPSVLVRYGDYLLEGIELAIRDAEERQGRSIELVVIDDAGGTRTGDAVRELERRGALAIIGPLLPQQIAEAAGARRDPGMVLISPTVQQSSGWSETYALNSGDPLGARELGRYAADSGLSQAAFLYARTPDHEAKARAFALEFETRGGRIRAMVPYDSGTTTFGDHMEAILARVRSDAPGAMIRLEGDSIWADTLPPTFGGGDPAAGAPSPTGGARPFALFVAAPQRDVPKIAPQVSFYGLDSAGVQVFGDEAWASAEVRRLVPDRDLEGAIAVSPFPPDRAQSSADPAFVRLYEDTYRRSLDNPLPALGFDAANLVVQALPNRLLSAAALSRRFDLLAGIRGATGLLSVRANRVVRRPYLVQIIDGDLVPAPAPVDLDLPVPKPATRTGSTGRGSPR